MNYGEIIKKTYKDKLTIIEFVEEKDALTKITNHVEKEVLKDYPCKLSFSTATSASGGEIASVNQSVKLFCDIFVNVHEGSKLIITRSNGKVLTYQRSGYSSFFEEHQEISLELFKDNGEKA